MARSNKVVLLDYASKDDQSIMMRQSPGRRGQSANEHCVSYHGEASSFATSSGPPSNILPKEINQIRHDIISTGAITFNQSNGQAVVELSPAKLSATQPTVAATHVVSIFAYLFYVHSRQTQLFNNGSIGRLNIVLDWRKSSNRQTKIDSAQLIAKSLAELMNWLPESIKRIFWLVDDQEAEEAEASFIISPKNKKKASLAQASWKLFNEDILCQNIHDDIYQLTISQCTTVTMAELHAELGTSSLSDLLQGTSTVDQEKWVQFRQALERLLKSCSALGELYVSLYEDFKSSADNDELYLLSSDDLFLISNSLREKHHLIEESECYHTVKLYGESLIQHLMNDFDCLHSKRYYSKSIQRATNYHHEVSNIMSKAVLNVHQRCQLIENIGNAKNFIKAADEIINYCVNVAQRRADQIATSTSVSLVRLRLQEAEYEQFLMTAKLRLQQGEDLAIASQSLCSQSSDDTIDSSGYAVPTLSSEFKEKLESKHKTLVDVLETTTKKLYQVRDTLADRHVAYHMLEKIYDWALCNAKWSVQLSMNVTRAMETKNDDDLRTLLIQINKQLDAHPTTELEQLPDYAQRLNDTNMTEQIATLTKRCDQSKSTLAKLQEKIFTYGIKIEEPIKTSEKENEYQDCDRDLSNLNKQQEDRKSICAENVEVKFRQTASSDKDIYEEPLCYQKRASIASKTKVSNEDRTVNEQWQRRSYAGSVSHLPDPTPEIFKIPQSARYNESNVNFIHTGKVIHSMSEATLKKRLSHRNKTVSTCREEDLIEQPVKFDRKSRLGSARSMANKVAWPFKKLMKRSATFDELSIPESIEKLRLEKNRQLMLKQRNSIEENIESSSITDDVQSPITERSSIAEACNCCQPSSSTDHNHCTDQSNTQSDDNSTNFDEAELTAINGFDQSPNNNVDRIMRLPSPDINSTPDERMLYMTVNELLSTEIKYVQALQYVIKHYVPELQRTDLPFELMNSRKDIFGNLDAIHRFHAYHFLPDLQTRIENHLQKHELSDNIALEIGELFRTHAASFYLYALYNKNKPRSDIKLAECAAVFFKTKQLTLEDHLDLSAYLLKPVQRMGKYVLFIQQLKKIIANEEIAACLQVAEDVVGKQLRHGNDLLAMDLIKHSQKDLKEQGALIRQDDFLVYEKRTLQTVKCNRRVFLFEKSIIFTKPKPRKNGSGGTNQTTTSSRLLADTFEFKFDLPIDSIGLTEVVKDQPAKFEVYLRSTQSGVRYVLEAMSVSVRNDWLNEIRILLNRQLQRWKERAESEYGPSSNVGIGQDLRNYNEHCITNRQVQASNNNQNNNNAQKIDKCSSNRPHSLISIGTSSECSSSTNGSRNTSSSPAQRNNIQSTFKTPAANGQQRHGNGNSVTSFESGIVPDTLAPLVENPNEADYVTTIIA